MRKVLIIARREYQALVRRKVFVLSVLLMPLIMIGGVMAQAYASGRVDLRSRKVIVVDGTGQLFDALKTLAAQRNDHDLLDDRTGQQTRPAIVLERWPSEQLTDDERLALSDRARNNEISGFMEIDPDVLDLHAPSPPQIQPVRIFTESIRSNDVEQWLSSAVNKAVSTIRLKEAGLDPAIVENAVAPLNVQQRGLYSRDDAGEIRKAGADSRALALVVPLGMMMVMFLSLMLTMQPMLMSVLEEKQQRIAEVLLGSASPFQIMAGKLLGTVAVALTFVAIYALGAYFAASYFRIAHLIPFRLAGWFVVFEILASLTFGSIFIAVGAACSDIKDVQGLLMPVMLLLVAPMFVWTSVINAPLGDFATWASLFPPATPMLMMVRLSASPTVPLWQPVLGIFLLLITATICVWAAGRILRIGLLMQGKAPKWYELLAWVARG